MDDLINPSIVYCILNIYTGKRYVGSTTKNLPTRKRQHLYELRKGKHISKLLQKEYDNYGEESIKFVELEKVLTFSRSSLFQKEQEWIDRYKPEYNTNELAGNHFPASAKTKRAMKKANGKRIGRKQSEEEKQKRADAVRKYWATHPPKTIPEEMREHLSKINTGKNNPNWGLKRSIHTKTAISDSNAKITYVFLHKDGHGCEFRNLSKNAEAELGIPYWQARQLYRGQKEEYGGWKFIEKRETK